MPRLLEQPGRPVRGRQVGDERAPADRGRHRLELVRAPARHEHRAPRAATARAAAAPIPPVAPVTSTVRPPRETGAAPAQGLRGRRHAKTATVAVKLWTKYSPPTGPISPAAKNPAAGAPPSSSDSAAAS